MKLMSSLFAFAVAISLHASPSADAELKRLAVKGINGIVDAIQAPYGTDELAAKFHIFGDDISKAQVIFLGENHFHEPSYLDQARALQNLLDPEHDVVLLEGGQAGTDGFCNQLVYRHYLLQLANMMNDKLEKTNKPLIASDEGMMGSLFHTYGPMFGELLYKLRINEPKVMKCKCLYWDEDSARGLESISAGMAKRHEAMAHEIKKHTSKGRRVFVIAGLGHLPNGDLMVFKDAFASPEEMSLWMPKDKLADFKKNRISPEGMSRWYGLSRNEVAGLNVEQFYSTLASFWRIGLAGLNRDTMGYGLSKGVYDFLKREKLAYTELIPKAIIQPLKAKMELSE